MTSTFTYDLNNWEDPVKSSILLAMQILITIPILWQSMMFGCDGHGISCSFSSKNRVIIVRRCNVVPSRSKIPCVRDG